MTPVYPLANARLKALTSIDEAFIRIASLAEPIAGEEVLALAESLGRITSHDLLTEAALPRFDHSAMDGFGLSGVDLARPAPFDLVVSARVFAGGIPPSKVSPGSAARLLTGAPIPAGVDAVVPEEACIASGDTVRVLKAVAPRRTSAAAAGCSTGRGHHRGTRRTPAMSRS